MLVSSFHITHVLPCLADPEKIRTIAQLSDDIHEVLPYLNATLKGTTYNHAAGILTFKKDGAMITLYPITVTLAKVDDENHAKRMMEWLKAVINETFENRKNIQPDYERGTTLRALDIFKLIPGTNCKGCGEPSCLAFAVKLAGREIEVARCVPLFSAEYQDKRKVLLELLYAAGYSVPSVSLDPERGVRRT
ncbi:MAG: Fe-S cluster protein [Proteobacteria bacterium]|nr:Fe-S cluster protein [Pseudomonadota bacterium]